MKKYLLLLSLLLLSGISSWAYAEKIEIDGINYNLYSSEKTAEVTSPYINAYSGSVVIPEAVTYEGTTYSVTSIGDDAFYGCSDLTSIVIPSSVTEIGDEAFFKCHGLTKAEFASVESLCKMRFHYMSNPLYYAHLYIDGKEVTDVVVPNIITSIEDFAFWGCRFLTSVRIPESVQYICHSAFEGCSGLTSVTFNNGLKHIGSDAFADCRSLTSVSIPESVDHIGGGAFDGCDCLTKAEFASIDALCNIHFGDTVNANPLYYAHHLYIDGEEVKEVIIPNGVESVGNNAFAGGSYITSISIPSSVTSIGNNAFEGCKSLSSIVIPEGVTAISDKLFNGCEKLASVTLPQGITTIGYGAFSGCKRLPSVFIPKSVSSIGHGAFKDCSNLSLVISEAKSPTIGYYVFEGISSDAILSIPPFSEEAYKDCIGYFDDYTTDLKVSGLYFNLDDDGDGTAWVEEPMLDKKPYSGDIVIPSAVTYEGVEYPVRGIDDNAFKDATITSVVIPDGVRNIDDQAFYNCENLTQIVIPKTVRSIGEAAFMYCDDVEELVCLVKNPFPIQGKGAEGATFSNYFFNNVPLYVPKGTAEEYRQTEGWKDFANIVDGLPTGVNQIAETEDMNNVAFDLSGKHIAKSYRGMRIMRAADGTTKKVILNKNY